MAPSRGKGKTAARPARKSTRSNGTDGSDVPDVYQSMLAEAENDADVDHDRPLKRRKVANGAASSNAPASPASPSLGSSSGARSGHALPRADAARLSLQTIEASSDDNDSDLEFEDVDLQGQSELDDHTTDGIEDLSISVQPESNNKRNIPHRRKPATFAEKAHRLQVHKLHVLCLLGHCIYVNGRCNNAVVQRHLRSILSDRTISYLNPDPDETQFQRNRSFMDGLQQALDTFTAEFRVKGGGLRRPHWEVENDPGRKHEPAGPVDRSDFITAAKNLEGSQDVANQLFCALLRSADIETRVVCSLQVLPFTSVPKGSTPSKPVKETIYAQAPQTPPSRGASSAEDLAVNTSASIGKVPAARRRLGQPTFSAEVGPATPPKTKSKVAPKLSYPVFWVEAFNRAQQKWIAIDPMVTHTVNKPTKLEPPSSYDLNQMTYVIAFEDGGVVRDVTKRYAKAYNAKTRRHRVEASIEGAKWFKKAMRIFRRRGGRIDRDQLEDAELAQKEAKEGMPGNVLDFKDHPYYALERHMKRHEVIHPRREVGKVNAGTAAKPRMEPVFRRQDVQSCKSADKWYRVGREIKQGEQPLKQVPSRARRQRSINLESDDDERADTVGLYAPYQTQQYVPAPVQRGRIPKNAFGNLDVYVPSMVPPGGIHLTHKFTQQAAKLLKVDYADAVTGFKFQGRQGTAIVEGAVVAEQYEDAVRAVIEGFEDQIVEDESKTRSLEALRLWKRFLTGLRIAERVKQYGDGSDVQQELDQEMQEDAAPEAGGFVLADIEAETAMPTAGKYTLSELAKPVKGTTTKKRKVESSEDEFVEEDEDDGLSIDHDGAGGFMPDEIANDTDMAGGFVPEQDDRQGGFVSENHDGAGRLSPEDEGGEGGFMPNDEDDAGGFVLDEPVTRVNTTTEDQKQEYLPHHENVGEGLDADGEDLFGDNLVSAQNLPAAMGAEPHLAMHTDEPVDTTVHDARNVDERDEGEEHDSDKGSILSHDPDDDDAEPEWLESD